MAGYRKRKTVYRKIQFKLTKNQKQSLDNYCKTSGTTMVKMIKKAIEMYIEKESKATRNKPKNIISEKQLNIFDLIEAETQKK